MKATFTITVDMPGQSQTDALGLLAWIQMSIEAEASGEKVISAAVLTEPS